jgi:hypothetical protein
MSTVNMMEAKGREQLGIHIPCWYSKHTGTA